MARPPAGTEVRSPHQLVTELSFAGASSALLRKLADRIDAGEVRCTELGYVLTEDVVRLTAVIDMRQGVAQ